MIIVIDTDKLPAEELAQIAGILYASETSREIPLSESTNEFIRALSFRMSYTENDIKEFLDNAMLIETVNS